MSNLATGATELMLAMQTPTPKGYWGVPVLVWGMPGTGKSTFIESLQRDGFPVYTMIASLHDPTDFNGLPALHNGRMRFAPPETVFRKLIGKEPGGNKGWLQHQIEQDATLLPMMRELGQHYEELTGILERLQPKG